MEKENEQKFKFKEYSKLTKGQFLLGKKIEDTIIPLAGSILDYVEMSFKSIEAMADTSSGEKKDFSEVYDVLRSKILRDANDSVRKLLRVLSYYGVDKVTDIIQIKQNKQEVRNV